MFTWTHKVELSRRLLVGSLYACVFLTGAAGLIYEVTWQKYLCRLVGSDTMAIAIIIGTFLGGLALGFYLCGKLSSRVSNQFGTLAILEGIIGLWCLSFPALFHGFYNATISWSFEPPFWIITQGILSSLVLFGIPTICMGATVPLLTQGITADISGATKNHARLYGINTVGGFLGTLAAGFWILPKLGLPQTMMITSTINIGCSLYLFALSRTALAKQPGRCAPQTSDTGSQTSQGATLSRRTLLIVVFLSGLYVMTFENVLIRVANLSLGSSSYTFSLIVSVFLLAIAIGSFAVGRLRQISLRTLFLNQLILCIMLMILYVTLDTWPYFAHLVRLGFQGSRVGFSLYYLTSFVLLTVVLLLPLAFCGATVPIAFHLAKRDLGSVGRDSGLLLSFNTTGNLLGSILGGVVIYYVFDIHETFMAAVLVASLTTVVVSLRLQKKFAWFGLALVAIAFVGMLTTPLFDTNRFSAGIYRYRVPTPMSFAGPAKFFENYSNRFQTLFRTDGPSASVAVVQTETKDPGAPYSRAVLVNGKSDSDTYFDSYTTKLSAHLPALLAAHRRKALVVGMGTGITVGELAKYEFTQLTVAETSPSVIDALPYFRNSNNNIADDPRLDTRLGDAFRSLGRSGQEWDVIVSEPSNPWVAGVDSLYTEEFYQLVKDHLHDQGTFLQWIHVYSANLQMVGMAANTLVKYFPEVHAFRGARGDLLFVAKNHKITRDDLVAAQRVLTGSPTVNESLEKLHIKDIDSLLLRQVWTSEQLRQMFFEYERQTLDHPRLHYIAGSAFFKGEGLKERHLYPANSSFFASYYLLNLKDPSWNNRPWSMELYDKYTDAFHTSLDGKTMVAQKGVMLAAHLQNPAAFPLTRSLQPSADIPLVRAMANLPADQRGWSDLGLGSKTRQQRASNLLEEMHGSRSWLVPYPINGLKQLLKEGVADADEDAERNWFQLQLIRIALLEGLSLTEISPMFDLLSYDTNGKPLIHPADDPVWPIVTNLWRYREHRQLHN